MKLAVDALNLRADRRGMGRIVRGVLQVAIAEGHDVTLLANENRLWDDEPEAAVTQMRIDHPRSARHGRRYDAIWYPWNGIRFSADAPSLAHIHDTFALHEKGISWVGRRRIRKPLFRAAREATLIATDSAWSRERIERELHVPAQRIVVILPAPDAFFTPGEVADPSLPASPYVLMVGAGDARKNAAFLVEAFADAFGNEDVRLVVVGSMSTQAQHAAERRGVRLVRETPSDERLRSLYRAASCVAVPSIAEGFGLVVVEAQACGSPVIASNAAAIPEAAGDAAILLSPHDRRAWRDSLREVLFDAAAASRLRALSAGRWNLGRRDAPARAILAALRDLVDQRA